MIRASSLAIQLTMCVLTLQISHRPHGRLTFACCSQGGGIFVEFSRYSGTVTITSSLISGNTANHVRARCAHAQKFPSRSRSKVPIAPMGDSRFARCLQGGGVHVAYGSVSIVNSQIYSNTADYVRADIRKFPSPQWETHILLAVCRAAVSMSMVAH